MFVAREEQLAKMEEIVEKSSSSFVAIYGRRRVGKTEFVRHFCKIKHHFFIEFTGKRKTSKKLQITSFIDVIKRTFSTKYQSEVQEWAEAFSLLRDNIEPMKPTQKKIIFSCNDNSILFLLQIFFAKVYIF